MLKAIFRFLILMNVMFLDRFTSIVFDKREVTNYSFYGGPIKTEKEIKQNVLLDYLKECHRKTYSEAKNGKKQNNKKDDRPKK